MTTDKMNVAGCNKQ